MKMGRTLKLKISTFADALTMMSLLADSGRIYQLESAGDEVRTFGAKVCELLDDWESRIRENERDVQMPNHSNMAVLAAERLTLQIVLASFSTAPHRASRTSDTIPGLFHTSPERLASPSSLRCCGSSKQNESTTTHTAPPLRLEIGADDICSLTQHLIHLS